ncbi:hypothetical protein PENARI_c024G01947 [Penicillium arizonense]|uniref:Uncharacterized protein n=1 Tax=Penicillium arizonense TaxID=1835702 RepID=A0A1F5L7V0_PENAI|nr:hypothetical protein PENARI_c024G01947 [Penicillium arizonense]OGE49029.1 hypothetical protein PENARI_c024G01947 [Penicillium arizonense]
MGNAISSEGGQHHPLLAEDYASAEQVGKPCTNVFVQSPERQIKDLSGKTPDDEDTITANPIAEWPKDIPTPTYIESDAAIGVLQADIPPGYWAKLAKKCAWRCRAVKRPGTLLFKLAALPLCREPVLKQGHGSQTAGLQNGLEFSNSVAVKKENVEALLAHVSQVSTEQCRPARTAISLSDQPQHFPSHHQHPPWDCSTGMPSTDSESEYLDSPHGDSESEVHGAAASDVTHPNTRKKRRLRYDDDIINGIRPESNDIVLMSPYLSIIDKSAS